MGKLNAPRNIPYSFKVFAMDSFVWLYDDSARTYICSSQPVIWAEPLYVIDDESDEGLPDPDYYDPDVVKNAIPLCGDFPFDMDEKEAWDDAREAAHANHLI